MSGWRLLTDPLAGPPAQLVLVFGERHLLEQSARFEELRAFYPAATVLLVTTSSMIANTAVSDGTIVATALALAHTPLRGAVTRVSLFMLVAVTTQFFWRDRQRP